jgi:hypothetical protein
MAPPRPCDLTACRRCKRPIFWAFTGRGRRMPLDAEPHPDGTIAAYKSGTGTWMCRTLKHGEEPHGYELRYMTHFATCLVLPSSAKWLPKGVSSFAAARARKTRKERRS